MRSEHQKTVDELIALDELAYRKNPKTLIKRKREEMAEAVERLDFETAALIRDEIYRLEGTEPKRRKQAKRSPSGK